MIDNGLSLTQLTNLLNGVNNLTSLDVSKNDITCVDCISRYGNCNCSLVNQIDVLINKVVNPHNFSFTNMEHCSYDMEKMHANRGKCEKEYLVLLAIYMGRYKTINYRTRKSLKIDLKNYSITQ